MPKIRKVCQKTKNPYLNFYELEAEHRNGGVAPYYMASRAKETAALKALTGENPPDGVAVCSFLGEQMVLIRQFRYPLGAYVYELPAGLLEPGEAIVEAATREFFEETGLQLQPVEAGAFSRPFFSSVGMTDESCALIFGRCTGIPNIAHQEESEDIQVVLADRAHCRRILAEESVALLCAYQMMHFVSQPGDPLAFLKER